MLMVLYNTRKMDNNNEASAAVDGLTISKNAINSPKSDNF